METPNVNGCAYTISEIFETDLIKIFGNEWEKQKLNFNRVEIEFLIKAEQQKGFTPQNLWPVQLHAFDAIKVVKSRNQMFRKRIEHLSELKAGIMKSHCSSEVFDIISSIAALNW